MSSTDKENSDVRSNQTSLCVCVVFFLEQNLKQKEINVYPLS